MTGETFFQLHYHLTDTERLFDLADGTVSFDADGIREENEKGRPTHFDWADWDVCVMTQKVIVLTFRTPVLLFFPYSREAAITVEHAARAFGKEDSLVYRRAAGNM